MPSFFSVKKYLPRSLFARSLLIITAPIVITLIISTYVFFERHWERMAGRLANGVAGEVSFISRQVDVEPPLSFEVFQVLQADSFSSMDINLKWVVGGKIPPDQFKYEGRGNVIKKILSKELKDKIHYPHKIIVDVEEKWIQIQLQLKTGALIFTLPERRLFSSSGYVFLLWMIGVSSILLVVATLFMRNQIRPIKRLAIAAERFGKGRDVPFFKPEGAREVRQAARAFLGMRERMNRQMQQRTEMLAGISHDLRTPLTRMKLQAEMFGDNDDAKALKSDIADMEKMIEGYLQFIRGEGAEPLERVDFLEMVHRVVDKFKSESFNLEVESKGNNFSIFLRPIAFERCLGNLLSNAEKYADTVKIKLTQKEGDLVLIIDDNGCGIDESLYGEVFKPFFREENSRNKKTGGIGLGLPIAKDIVLAHGGIIDLYKSPEEGLRVRIELPF